VALLVGGFFSQKYINRLEWDVPILIAVGLALGYGLNVTELDARIVAILPIGLAAAYRQPGLLAERSPPVIWRKLVFRSVCLA
jgi:hypothetical protein